MKNYVNLSMNVICMYVVVRMSLYVCMYVCMCMRSRMPFIKPILDADPHLMCVCMHKYIHTCIHTCMHAHTHTTYIHCTCVIDTHDNSCFLIFTIDAQHAR
jgi:hypothetical protein